VRKKDHINIESKLKISRFLGELVKFKMFLKVDILFCIKQLLFDFSHHHIG
jgi:regulator of nonsense transcripts 2